MGMTPTLAPMPALMHSIRLMMTTPIELGEHMYMVRCVVCSMFWEGRMRACTCMDLLC